VQQGFGVSVAFDLISLPLPLTVSLGIDCEAGDPPELCVVNAFYPVILWDLPAATGPNPVDAMVTKLESDTTSLPSPHPRPNSTLKTEELLLEALRILQSSDQFREFVESEAHDSVLDGMLAGAQSWLDSGDTSHLNLPGTLQPPSPATLTGMRPILAATQMTFELAYSRPSQDHTLYPDCVTTVRCRPGEVCRIEVTAAEAAALIPADPPIDPAEFENVWIAFDTTQESYLTHDTIAWQQFSGGKAVYEFVQNTETPVLLGISIHRLDMPASITAIQDKNLQLCRRHVLFDGLPQRSGMPPLQLLLDEE
jgi:hypothetical protein